MRERDPRALRASAPHGCAVSILDDIPEVVVEGAITLAKAIAKLIAAPDAEARRDVYMTTAEEMKALADKEKFG